MAAGIDPTVCHRVDSTHSCFVFKRAVVDRSESRLTIPPVERLLSFVVG